MNYFNDDSNFNLFCSTSYQIHNQNQAKNNSEKKEKDQDLYLNRLSSIDINTFQNEMKKYDRKISVPDDNYKYYHFDFNGPLNTSYDQKEVTDNKSKSNKDVCNFSVFKRKIKSNSLYVGFENKYGENSCYINVVLHFLYFFPCINEYLIKLYQTYKDTINFSNGNITNIKIIFIRII